MEKELNPNKTQELTYEQLKDIAHQLSNQNNQLLAKLQEATMYNTFKRLDYLFKVVESNAKFNIVFKEKCIKEIEDIITVPEEKPDENE